MRGKGIVAAVGFGFACCVLVAAAADTDSAPHAGPHLERHGSAMRLVVQGKPFLILGGELHNSSASSLAYMEPIWRRLREMNLNTVLAPVSWELLEPEEGKFDFALVDGLIDGARRNGLKLVFLWFGSWKNGVSDYVPGWVKTDLNRFPRMRSKSGQNLEVLTPLSQTNRDADADAFSHLMRHIREADQGRQTVLMMQVENEVGLLGDSRDRSPLAQEAFAGPVPAELTAYLVAHKDALIAEFAKSWRQAGAKTGGTWPEVFGEEADEAFMAWHMAAYIGQVAAAGRTQYDIPMYANAWLIQSQTEKAGGYPSGGPVSKVMDVWRAGAPAIEFLSPDIYLSNFDGICASYARNGNTLFIPEARRDAGAGARAALAFGKYNAIGFCPFGIDSLRVEPRAAGPREPSPGLSLKDAYDVLQQLAPLILDAQGGGPMAAVLQMNPQDQRQDIDVAGYHFEVRFERSEGSTVPGYGIVVAKGPDEFLVAGQGLEIGFSARTPGPKIARILSIDEGHFQDSRW